ncbi:hypothetical protein E2C01_045341 [Portunus trituberculatus]|uniref:Uncharacterized protein n=1 Tax=Portunus trituberculatus TaxID=210409 RepID=A0A5B7G1Z7_PORTR|nr:hypothetical protein [Portunus trituberculatus]
MVDKRQRKERGDGWSEVIEKRKEKEKQQEEQEELGSAADVPAITLTRGEEHGSLQHCSLLRPLPSISTLSPHPPTVVRVAPLARFYSRGPRITLLRHFCLYVNPCPGVVVGRQLGRGHSYPGHPRPTQARVGGREMQGKSGELAVVRQSTTSTAHDTSSSAAAAASTTANITPFSFGLIIILIIIILLADPPRLLAHTQPRS